MAPIENDIMTSASSRGDIAAWKPIALVSALTLFSNSSVFAQTVTEKTLAPVIVSASRFASDPASAPIGATVITADQIREAGIGNVNEAIRKIGGVYGRQNLTGSPDFSLDLRGFGTNSDQNVVILVDGIRLSENELQPALMSAIPIESIERIEIVRGGSSVLYGEGATSGTIQIITKRGMANTTRGSVVAEIGNRGQQELRASLAKGWDNFSIDANLGTLRTDNYRDNNDLKQENFGGGMQWASKEGRFGLRADVARQDSRFAGSLSWDEFKQNPQQTNTPFDFGSIDSERYTLFGERNLGNLQLAAELSHREKISKGNFDSDFGISQSRADSEATQFSPRFKYLTASAGVKNELVAGMDFSDSKRITKSTFAGFPSADADASQEAAAIYARDEIRLGKARIAIGARHEKFDQNFTDPLSFGLKAYHRSFSLNAWDLQGSYELTPLVNLFAKAGKSYRVANVDEYTFTSNNEVLDPQRSNDLELGASFGKNNGKLMARVFRHKLKDEIFFDPTVGAFGANANLDPTRRQGLEIEASTRIASAFTLSAVLQHVSAKFTDGPNDGKEMVLVPKNTATLRLNWLPGNGRSADVGVQWVDSQRYGSDFDNTCAARIPSYATLDARYAVRVGAWEFAVAGANLTDKDYFTQAFGCKSGIYPDAGRAVKFTARMDF